MRAPSVLPSPVPPPPVLARTSKLSRVGSAPSIRTAPEAASALSSVASPLVTPSTIQLAHDGRASRMACEGSHGDGRMRAWRSPSPLHVCWIVKAAAHGMKGGAAGGAGGGDGGSTVTHEPSSTVAIER
eukprot:1090713-Prymnesium_polylepis.1